MKRFLEAVKRGDVNEVTRFIEEGVDINLTNDLGGTAVHIASGSENIKMVELLLNHGAAVDGVREHVVTPLQCAAMDGNVKMAEYLISRGAFVNKRSQEGYTPIYRAALNGNLKMVELLISQGADVNIADNNLETPLHMAANRGHFEVAKVLIINGADVNARESGGNTPLGSMAMHRGKQFSKQQDYDSNESLQTAKLLLENGADPNNGIYVGSTYEFAKKNKDNEMLELLVKYGVVPSRGGCLGVILMFALSGFGLSSFIMLFR